MKKATGEEIQLQRHLSHPTKNAKSYLNKVFSSFMAIVLFVSLHSFPVSAASGITSNSYPGFYGIPSATTQAANGDLYLAYPEMGAVRGGQGIRDFKIYKWTSASNSYSLETSVNAVVGLNQLDDYYGELKMEVDTNGTLHVAFLETGSFHDSNWYAYSKGVYYGTYNINSNSWSSGFSEIETQGLPTQVGATRDFYTSLQLQVNSSGDATIAYVKNSNVDPKNYHIKIKTGSNANTTWSETILNTGDNVSFNNLLKDNNGNFSVVYSIDNATRGPDIYVSSAPYATSTEVLTGDNNYYSYYGSAIDSLNHIHVLYGAEGFKIVSNTGNGGSWETSVIDNVDYLATSTDFSQTVSRLVIDANDNMFVLAASIDPSTYAATSYYYYGKFAGSNTWMKGKNDIPELNNMIGKDLDWLHPFVPSTGNLMLQYFEKNTSKASYVYGKQTDFFASSSSSDDASLSSVLGQNITTGAEAGTTSAPKTATIEVSNGASSVSAGDIVKHDAAATVTFYGTDSTYMTPAVGSVNLTSGSGTDVYIKVVAADNTTLYYKISINRMAPISNFANTAKTSTSASFSWTAASGATGIVIEQSPAGTNTWTTAQTSGTIAANATSATVTGLNPATSYDFRLVVTGGTNAGTSNVVSNITTDNAPSVPLTDFASAAKTSTSASFSWTAASGATGIVIEQSPAGANTWTTSSTSVALAANATSGTVTGLNPATSYDFRLVVTGGTNTGPSNVVSNITTDNAPSVPLTDFASAAKTSTSASFSWTAASGATGIVIEQSPAGANTWTTSSTSVALAANATSGTVTGLNPATSYDFRLVVTGGTNTGPSNVVSNITTDNAPSVSLTDFASTAKTSTSASFSWTAASGATGIVIEQSPAGANTWTTSSTSVALAANATSGTVTGLNPATSYDFRLVVIGGTNAGPSNVVSNITTDNAPSVSLTDFASTAKTSTSASFSWTAASGATGIVIEQSPAGANTWTTSSTSVALAANATSGTVTGLNPATSYDFRLVVTGGTNAGPSNVVSNITTDNAPSVPNSPNVPSSPSSPVNSGSVSSTPSTDATGVDILVNGKVESAGTATTSQRNNQTVTTISVDQKKLDNKLASEGSGAVVTLPVNTKSDIVIGELNGQMIKNLESYSATLEIRTARATYTLPAQQININALSAQLGKELNLQDIKVRIEIAAPITDMMQVVDQAAGKNWLTLIAPPTDFKISATYGSTTIDVSKFNAYVERSVALPNGIDPNKITTGLVVEPDGSVRHVPTKVIFKEGMYYARINSLTNSTYSVVWHPLEFTDVAKHWAKNAVNDMGSRMIVNGTGNEQFKPDQDITRAEFAASIVRGLGLKLENEATPFSDVTSSHWYSSVISTAYAYELLDGYPDGTFRPMDKITREQAMVILSKAMILTRLKEKQPVQSTDGILQSFQDAASVSHWAQSSVMESVQAGIISGRSTTALVPKAFITRAEVATIIQKLLQKSELI